MPAPVDNPVPLAIIRFLHQNANSAAKMMPPHIAISLPVTDLCPYAY